MNASWTNSLWVDAAGGLLLGGIVLAASWLYAAGNGSCEHESEAGHCALVMLEAPRDADDVYVCGPTRFMGDMKEALASLGVAPERIRVELFNGSESITPGVVGAAPRAPHLPNDDADTAPLVTG